MVERLGEVEVERTFGEIFFDFVNDEILRGNLDERRKYILEQRMLFNKTLRDLSKEIGISVERIRWIEGKAIMDFVKEIKKKSKNTEYDKGMVEFEIIGKVREEMKKRKELDTN